MRFDSPFCACGLGMVTQDSPTEGLPMMQQLVFVGPRYPLDTFCNF